MKANRLCASLNSRLESNNKKKNVELRGVVRVHHPRLRSHLPRERDFFIDNLLVRVHFIIVMIRWTGLAPWEFEFPFPGSLTST